MDFRLEIVNLHLAHTVSPILSTNKCPCYTYIGQNISRYRTIFIITIIDKLRH